MEHLELQRYMVGVLERLGIPYFITGSVASIFYGEPRFTNDIDFVADVKPEHITSLLAAFPTDRFYLSDDAIREALRHKSQFNILDPDSGLKIDIIIPGSGDHDRQRFARRVRVRPAPDFEAFLTSPEDLIIKKMKYYEEGGSEKHLRDIAGMLKISRDRIDKGYISDWANRMGLADIWSQFASMC